MARWLWAVLVLATYTAALAMPAYLDLAGHEAFAAAARSGLAAVAKGEITRELLGWLPNVLLWLGVALLLAGEGKNAAEVGVAAMVGAGSWLSLSGLLPGYYVWVGSLALLIAGGVWVATSTIDEQD